jgi:folate-dependent phosphoribosylglycinamide formyltransferase PurN
MKLTNFFKIENSPPRVLIFMSGSGTNAEKLLESISGHESPPWIPVAILSDNPQRSRAAEIAKKHAIPFIEHDIKKFYQERGENTTSLATKRGKMIRDEWTDAMRAKLRPLMIDFGILAGFIPLTNICADFPCLNVHPGDLTVETEGRRLLVGLHTKPIEIALLEGFPFLRSSVIIAQAYTGSGDEMDSGPILGISGEVAIELNGLGIDILKKINSSRPEKKPPGGFKDQLEYLAKLNQEKLKINGDWTVFPPAVADFAKGLFKKDADGNLFYKTDGEFLKVRTIVYHDGKKRPITDILYKDDNPRKSS